MSRLPARVLALGAHPDDLELSCAGTLARFLNERSEVQLAVVCRGDRGGIEPGLADRRRAESEAAARILGAPVHFLDAGDAEVGRTPALRQRLIDLIRATRPELVITHGPTDYHDDHVQVSHLVSQATWYAASPGHAGQGTPLEAPPALVYMDNVAGVGFEPTHLVDITATVEIKRRMLACHASQLQRTDSALGALEDLAETLARLRGLQCGVRYAEGFRPALLWGRRRREPLLP